MKRKSADIRTFFNKRRPHAEDSEAQNDVSHPLPSVNPSVPPTPDLLSNSTFDDTNSEFTPPVTPSLLRPPLVNDIGALLEPTKSIEAICQEVSNLSNGEKYTLLYNHVELPSVLPTSLVRGCNRKFNACWVEKYPWLRYSPKLDGVFCGPCSLLLRNIKRRDKCLLVNRPYSNWVKISNALSNHSLLRYHQECLQDADILKATIDNPTSRIDIMTDNSLQARMNENKHIIRQIVRAIIFLAKQGCPFRGDVECSLQSNKKNPGNFLALLKNYAAADEALFNHLNTPKAKNATYVSPSTQNDIINIIGYDVILSGIIFEVKAAGFFPVLADEVSCHNVEHLPICLRFVDSEYNIRDEFVAFVKLARVGAVDIADAIMKTLENLGLSLSSLRGQGYDGASTMSGAKPGVQARIRECQPKALYTHCASHSFNLAILNSCSIPCIRICIDQIKNLTLFVKKSPKREGLLRAIASKNTLVHTFSRVPLLNTCITRWVENIDGWEGFSLAHPFLVMMCEVILYGDPDFPCYNDNWSPEDKKNALAYLKTLESFEFIYTMVTLSHSLLFLKEAVVKIQGKSKDIVSGVSIVMECCNELKRVREDVDNYSQRTFEHSSRIAENSNKPISMPRVSKRQQNRSNPEYISVEDYLKKVVAIPFLDHLVSDVSSRFTRHCKQVAALQELLPINLTEDTSISKIKEAIDFYADDLPNASIIDEEFCRWKSRWLPVLQKDRPETLTDSLKQCCPQTPPNIFTLLKLFSTLPLSSCSCERSASALRRLNNYLQCTQTEERLTALALIHMNYETEISVDNVCKLFLQKYPRRIEKANLLFD